jgi:hypothetical protein
MLEELKLFLLILSSVFVLVQIFNFIILLFEEEPKPIKINKDNQILLYLTISYIITYIII